jgi:Response regulator containing a CheY-like receiver domain and an HD-GYP domain
LLYGGETMKKILLVNDCKFESLIMKDYLNDIGYSVQVANEYDVFVQVRKCQPDIVIANLIMRDTTGDKLIEYIKSTNPKIICLLSSCDLIKLEDFIENKVDEVIHTPINKLTLSEILNRALSQIGNSNAEVTTDTPGRVLSDISYRQTDEDLLNNPSVNEKNNNFSFCPYCGQKLAVSDQRFLFCPYCGQKIKN